MALQNQLFIMNIIIGSEDMKLIVGLGNPGKDYSNTRHNVGFSFIDEYIKYNNINESWINKFDGLYMQTIINNNKVLFLKPQTFMNLSGISVKKIMDFFKIDVDDLLVISDDLDLKVGNFKLKMSGSSGGHNGLKNIEQQLVTNKFKRLKIGISNDKSVNTKDYVLGKISKDNQLIINELFIKLNSVLDDYFILSFSELMNKYNSKNK